MEIKPIARIHTDFSEKFGVPRQAGLAPSLTGKIVFEPEYRNIRAVKELDGFSHIWLIWEFSQCPDSKFSPTVRPPRLGGNRRVGVFASRSPFRPNRLGLSCVKIEKIETGGENAPIILVSGVDMTDGTPIYDIKPYIPIADCIPTASEGYTAQTKKYKISVNCDEKLLSIIPENKRQALLELLSNDPRPAYNDEEGKEYGVTFAGFNIRFKYENNSLSITQIKEV